MIICQFYGVSVFRIIERTNFPSLDDEDIFDRIGRIDFVRSSFRIDSRAIFSAKFLARDFISIRIDKGGARARAGGYR